MGLLDDAIRDHLELKRLRGADPGEVAREQREALEPDLGSDVGAGIDELGAALEDVDREEARETMPVRAGGAAIPTSGAELDASSSPAHGAELLHGGEETAELDMQTVMDEGDRRSAEQESFESPASEGQAGDVAPTDAEDVASTHVHDGGQLEWEVSAQSSSEIPPDVQDGDRAAGDDSP